MRVQALQEIPMSRTLVVFYSYTGNSRQLAKLLSAQHGWPVGEVFEQHPRSGGMTGFLRCVADSLFHLRPAVIYRGPDPADYKTVVLVSPVWLQQLCGPMRSFLRDKRDRIVRAAVFSTMGGRGASNAVAEIANILGRDPIVAEVATARDVEDGSCAAAAEAFGNSVALPGDATPARPAVWSPEAG
jgi:hypothetical protein